MIPVKPVSVKFPEDERARLKALADTLGWTESRVVRDSIAVTIYLIQNPEGENMPKTIGMARTALLHEGKDS